MITGRSPRSTRWTATEHLRIPDSSNDGAFITAVIHVHLLHRDPSGRRAPLTAVWEARVLM
jgi:hypothetical protein